MKMLEEISGYRKEWVYECYYKLDPEPKDYDKITKKKMVESAYKIYSDYHNIIDICTTRELRFLKHLVENGGKIEYSYRTFPKEKTFERKTLRDKFLICGYNFIEIPEEIYENVCLAIKNISWKETKKKDEINEILVSLCKMYGEINAQVLIEMASSLLSISKDEVLSHMKKNLVFNYYAFELPRYIPSIDKELPFYVYTDYSYLKEELDEQRMKQAIPSVGKIDINMYKSLFYNDFNVNNKTVKKFVEELESLPFLYTDAIEHIKRYALLNLDRQPLKDAIKSVPNLRDYDLSDFFKLMDEAMDEMPSGALNGLTPNEYKAFKKEAMDYSLEKQNHFVRQENACLSKKNSDLFYKVFFALLEYTNNKYKINSKIKKLYKTKGINPKDITDIRNYFWDNKKKIVTEFIKENLYNFNSEELAVTKDFSKGIFGLYFIAKYEKDYAVIIDDEKAYMVKGIHSNIDEVIPYDALPYAVYTALIPFKGMIIYDSIFNGIAIDLGVEFKKMVDSELGEFMRYYHL